MSTFVRCDRCGGERDATDAQAAGRWERVEIPLPASRRGLPLGDVSRQLDICERCWLIVFAVATSPTATAPQ